MATKYIIAVPHIKDMRLTCMQLPHACITFADPLQLQPLFCITPVLACEKKLLQEEPLRKLAAP